MSKLLKSEKIEITSGLIVLINISLWLLGAFYNEWFIGLAFAMWYPTIFITGYLRFILIPDLKIEEYKDKLGKIQVTSANAQREAIARAMSMSEEVKYEHR